MKICMLTTSYPRYEGDYAGCFVHNLSKELIKKGIDVCVLAPNDINAKSHEFIDNVEIYRFKYWFTKKGQKLTYGSGMPSNMSNSFIAKIQIPFFLFFFFLNGFIRARKCDLIHSHFLLSGFIALPLKYLLKKPIITTTHGSALRDLSYINFLSFFMQRIDVIISSHPELTEKLNHLKLSKKIIEIPNLISFGKYENEDFKKSLEFINKEFNLKDEKIVTFISRFVDFKDPITVVKSIPLVIKTHQDIRFFFVGDGPLMKEIKNLIKKLDIESYIILTGFRDDIIRFLKKSDVFIASSHVENIWSMTVVEAINQNVPCILTSVGYTNKIFTHLKNACLISPKDEHSLSRAISELLENKKLSEKISTNARLLIKEKGFENTAIINKTIKIYINLTSKV